MTALAILAGTFIVLLLFGVPIFFSLIAACIALLTSNGLMSPQLVMQRVYAGIDSFPLLALILRFTWSDGSVVALPM